MPVYMMQQAVQTESREEVEERKRQLGKQIEASGYQDKTSLNRLRDFLTEMEIRDISEMDYQLRERYEEQLKVREYAQTSVGRLLRAYDFVKRSEIDSQMKTLAGKQRYQWTYRDELIYLPYHPNREIAELFAKTRCRKH